MNNKLTVINYNNIKTIDSREVAEMVESRHADLLEKIGGYCKYLANGKFRSLDFFIPSTYIDTQGKERPCYLLTKKGCDMVANKTTGEKGVIFTAAYVTAFEQMREQIETGRPMPKQEPAAAIAAEKRATAMVINAKNRVADRMMKLYERAEVKPEYQILAMQDYFGEDGIQLPRIALQETKVTYDKGAIAERLGVLSKSGNPHAHVIGAIIRQLDIAPDEIEAVPYYRNGHDGTDYQYTESVIGKVAAWIEQRDYPTAVMLGDKTYNIRYRKAMGQVGA